MINRKASAADLLRRQVEVRSRSGRKPTKPEPAWWERSLEAVRHRQQEIEQRKALEQAEEEARNAPQSDAGVVAAAIKPRDPGEPIPLNGAAVLRAALSGVGNAGTVNGQ